MGAIYVNLKAQASIRKTDSLFVLPSDPHKGHPTSKSTIARGIRQLFARAYTLNAKTPALLLCVHFTRLIGVSWAFQPYVSIVQLCKADTWSSVYSIPSQNSTRWTTSLLQMQVLAAGFLAATVWSWVCLLLARFCLPSCFQPFSFIAWGYPRICEYSTCPVQLGEEKNDLPMNSIFWGSAQNTVLPPFSSWVTLHCLLQNWGLTWGRDIEGVQGASSKALSVSSHLNGHGYSLCLCPVLQFKR